MQKWDKDKEKNKKNWDVSKDEFFVISFKMKSWAKIEKEEKNLRTSVHKTLICEVLIENLISKWNVVSDLQPRQTILKSTSAEVPEII